MKTVATIAAVAVAITVAFASSASSSQKEVPAQAWQHLALTALTQDDDGPGDGLGQQINKLGREGWELVGVTPLTKNGTTVKTQYYFKRRLR